MDELAVLQDVTGQLDHAGIPYMLTGSLALSYYTQPRMTRDIDLVAEMERADAQRLATLFQPEYYVPEPAMRDAIRDRGMFNLIHAASVVKVNCIVRKDEPYRHTEFQRRSRVRLGDVELWLVSREDLIVSKIAWASDSRSEVQRRDVENLKRAIRFAVREPLAATARAGDLCCGVAGVKDTSPEMRELQHRLLMERSGEERLRMAVSMCQTARALVLSSLPDHITRAERRVQLFLRMYGNDFAPLERARIVERIRTSVSEGESTGKPL